MLATLVAGCNKDKGKYINIFAGSMSAGDSKVQMDPNHITTVSAQWVPGETIVLNGTEYEIAGASEHFHLINPDNGNNAVEPLAETMYAMYPGADSENENNENDVTVNYSTGEIVLNRLAIRMLDDGQQQMAFPMVACAEANSENLYFNHLTAGLKLTLLNQTESIKNVASLKVIAWSGSAVQSLSYTAMGRTFKARWAVQGPTVPTGNVGTNGETVYASASEMNFDLKSGNNDYVTLAAGTGQVSFCIPVTITSIQRLTVTGYAEDGTEMFHVMKNFDSENIPGVERNSMYTVPVITINN